jgi:Rieske Fe-S protein
MAEAAQLPPEATLHARSLMCPRRQPPKPTPEFLSRRDWVRIFVLGTAAELGAGLAKPQRIMATLAPSVNNSCVVPLDMNVSPFTALQTPGGSVRVFFSNGTTQLGSGLQDYFNPVTITRDDVDSNLFYAMDSTCTHENTAVSAYDLGSGLMVCPNHGSTYDIQGNVVDGAGGAGQQNLTRLPCEWDGANTVRVELKSAFNWILGNTQGPTAVPTVPLKITDITKQSVGASVTRWKLTFPVVRRANYRIKYYNDFSAAAQTMPYYTVSSGGTVSTSPHVFIYKPSLSQTNELYFAKSNQTLWVETPNSTTRGFFAVEMIVPAQFV